MLYFLHPLMASVLEIWEDPDMMPKSVVSHLDLHTRHIQTKHNFATNN